MAADRVKERMSSETHLRTTYNLRKWMSSTTPETSPVPRREDGDGVDGTRDGGGPPENQGRSGRRTRRRRGFEWPKVLPGRWSIV